MTGATGRMGKAAAAILAKSGPCTARVARPQVETLRFWGLPSLRMFSATGSIYNKGADQSKKLAGVKRDAATGGFSSVSAATPQPEAVSGLPGVGREQSSTGSAPVGRKQPALGFSPNAP